MPELDDLNQRFSIRDVLRFDQGQGNLPRAVIATPQAQAHVYLHGAHVTHFQRRDQKPLLFLSAQSLFQSDKPIRGGIPICFPWFGPKAGDFSAPIHGFARLLQWNVVETRQLPDRAVSLVLGLESSDLTRLHWPQEFSARYQVKIGATLELTLRVTNKSPEPFSVEEALHTYFSIGDVKAIRIDGLAGTRYIDKVDGAKEKSQAGSIGIEGETDRVYLDTAAPVIINDPALPRAITVGKSGSQTTVVWNPWINKAKAMADFGDDEWHHMVCVETANAARNAVQLGAGQTHEMRAVIS